MTDIRSSFILLGTQWTLPMGIVNISAVMGKATFTKIPCVSFHRTHSVCFPYGSNLFRWCHLISWHRWGLTKSGLWSRFYPQSESWTMSLYCSLLLKISMWTSTNKTNVFHVSFNNVNGLPTAVLDGSSGWTPTPDNLVRSEFLVWSPEPVMSSSPSLNSVASESRTSGNTEQGLSRT